MMRTHTLSAEDFVFCVDITYRPLGLLPSLKFLSRHSAFLTGILALLVVTKPGTERKSHAAESQRK
jgi:hypothetical protein